MEVPVLSCESHRRGHWKNSYDFLFSCISVSVGLGNVWRFPYLCYKNGGGVFLLIYFISMIFCGIPVFLLEVSLGQYLGSGGMTIIGHICPIMKGVGIASMVMVTYYNIYYCIIVAWSIFYFIASFVSIPKLPWDSCDGLWNTDLCWTANSSLRNNSITSVEEFWTHRVLNMNSGLQEGLGSLQIELVVTLLLGWTLIYFILCRGLHQSGYIIWFTALFPYFVMSILLVKALCLPGAWNGILAYIHIDWKYFVNGETWIDAATQIFFAYSVGTGALPALGSYNTFNYNYFRDSLITCLINNLTCLTAGVLVFAILGYMAFLLETTVHEVARSGPGLVFITYPELVLNLPLPYLWSILFFSMLIVLGIDTEFCSVESLITGICDNWSQTLRPYRNWVVFTVCVVLFLLGIPMVTQSGIYLFQIMDFYAASGMPLLWICFFETIAVSWLYGADRFSDNIYEMIGKRPHVFWYMCWKVFAPILMASIFLFYIVNYVPVSMRDYVYPSWAEIMGLAISFSSMIWIPVYAIYYMMKQPGSLIENLKKGLESQIRVRSDALCAQENAQELLTF